MQGNFLHTFVQLQVEKLGFKSVAHYLIHTRREGAIPEAAESSSGEKEGSFDAVPQSGAKEYVIAEDTTELDDGDEYEGDDREEWLTWKTNVDPCRFF